MGNNIPILTLPIKPSSYDKIGMYLAPLFANFLSKKVNGQFITFLNLLNSYKEQTEYVSHLLNRYNELGIAADCILSDAQMKNVLFEKIYSLAQQYHICAEKKEIVVCSCGKIDCLKESLQSQTGKTIYKNNDAPICQFCHERCKIIEKEVLLFKAPRFDLNKSFYFPTFSTKDFVELNSKFQYKKILISKQRNTNLPFQYQGKLYNLDVDFFWANYTALWPDKQKIILGSQRSIYPLFLINTLQKLHDPECETFSLLFPYIKNKYNVNIMQELRSLEDRKKQALYLLYSVKFKDKISVWDPNALNNIKKLDEKDVEYIYQVIQHTPQMSEEKSFRAELIDATNQLNVQKIIQDMKRAKSKLQVSSFLQNTGSCRR